MTEQELDRIMRQVLIDSIRPREDETPENTPVFQPSALHRRQMRAMLANPLRWAKKRESPLWRQMIRRAAMIAITACLSAGVVFAFSPEARAVVKNWVIELYEKQTIYRYSGESDLREMPVYEITALPEGFAEVDRYEELKKVYTTYANSNGNVIFFDYILMDQGGAVALLTEDSNVFDVTVNHMKGQFFESTKPNELNTVTWIDEERNLQFFLDGDFDMDDILHIAESVFLCETPK